MTKKTYFKNLDAIRSLAAMMVLLHHVEQNKFWMDLPNLWGQVMIDNMGKLSCVIFFVLSGFLITYGWLERDERASDDTASWFRFQKKRAGRIWPLYFLVITFSLIVLPKFISIGGFNNALEENFGKYVFIYLLFLPNLSRLLSPVIGLNQFWFIGVQEQFYWVWPTIYKFFKKSFLWAIPLLLIIKIGGGVFLDLVQLDSPDVQEKMKTIWYLFQVEHLLIGALGAFVLHTYGDGIYRFMSLKTLTFSLSSFLALFVIDWNFHGFSIIQGLIVLLMLFNLALNPRMKIDLDIAALRFLGKISFGIYAFHTSAIGVIIFLLDGWGLTSGNQLVFNLSLYSLSILVSVLVAAVSFRYFEPLFYSRRNDGKTGRMFKFNFQKSI